jgi:hypothetical protein
MSHLISEFAAPDLVTIMDSIKKILKIHLKVKSEDDKEPESKFIDLLKDFSVSNIEGADPAQVRIFESCHPLPPNKAYQHREQYQISQAIGY